MKHIKFTVSMDAEQKKLGNTKTIRTGVDFTGVTREELEEIAIKSRIITWQANIKSNWEDFTSKGFPAGIHLRDLPFGKSRTPRQPSQEEIENAAAKKIAALTPDQLQEFIKTGKFPV